MAVQFNEGYNFRYYSNPSKPDFDALRREYDNDFSDDSGWKVPRNSQIIVLTESGVKGVLGDRVFNLLTKRDAEEFVNPNKRKRKHNHVELLDNPKRPYSPFQSG